MELIDDGMLNSEWCRECHKAHCECGHREERYCGSIPRSCEKMKGEASGELTEEGKRIAEEADKRAKGTEQTISLPATPAIDEYLLTCYAPDGSYRQILVADWPREIDV